jgi:hypothetical protein
VRGAPSGIACADRPMRVMHARLGLESAAEAGCSEASTCSADTLEHVGSGAWRGQADCRAGGHECWWAGWHAGVRAAAGGRIAAPAGRDVTYLLRRVTAF